MHPPYSAAPPASGCRPRSIGRVRLRGPLASRPPSIDTVDQVRWRQDDGRSRCEPGDDRFHLRLSRAPRGPLLEERRRNLGRRTDRRIAGQHQILRRRLDRSRNSRPVMMSWKLQKIHWTPERFKGRRYWYDSIEDALDATHASCRAGPKRQRTDGCNPSDFPHQRPPFLNLCSSGWAKSPR